METTQITPALTADEWERADGIAAGADPYSPLATVALEDRPGEDDGERIDREIVATVALANARRDHSDPGKLTAHDAWIVETLAGQIDRQHPGGLRMLAETKALVAKIRALLPPE